MIRLDFNKQNFGLYQLIAGLTGFALIIIGCIIVLKPFFPAALLAVIFTLATWPAFDWLHRKLDRKRAASAAFVMTVLLALCFLAPLIIIGTSVADNYGHIYDTVQTSLKADPKVTADKLEAVPVVGGQLEKYWSMLIYDRAALSEKLQQYSGKTTEILLKLGGTIGSGLFDITLGVFIAYFLFRHGSVVADRTGALIEKFGGPAGARMLVTCKSTLIGVVYGLLGTALAQGALAAIGFWIAHVPGATFLGLITFFLSLVPMGPPLVWLPVALWLFSEGQTGWAIFICVWGAVFIGTVDNLLKPYFISRGSNLPLLLVLLGVIGGVMAFGFIGLFIGPVLLALAYSLVMEWSTVKKAAEHASTPPTPAPETI